MKPVIPGKLRGREKEVVSAVELAAEMHGRKDERRAIADNLRDRYDPNTAYGHFVWAFADEIEKGAERGGA